MRDDSHMLTDGHVTRRRALGILAFAPALTGCTALLRGDEPTEAETVYGQLMCNCGCNQVLGECTHVGCPNSVPMRAEVDGYLADGNSPEQTVTMFVNKYGTNIRSAPPGDGWFNVSAWITPFIVLAAGAGVVSYYVGGMLRRGRDADAELAASDAAPATLERLEDELADFTPED